MLHIAYRCELYYPCLPASCYLSKLPMPIGGENSIFKGKWLRGMEHCRRGRTYSIACKSTKLCYEQTYYVLNKVLISCDAYMIRVTLSCKSFGITVRFLEKLAVCSLLGL